MSTTDKNIQHCNDLESPQIYNMYIEHIYDTYIFSSGSDGKESTSNVGDPGLIPGWGRSLGGGNGNPLQHSCLENPTDREAWWATVHRVAQSRTQLKQLSRGN